MYSCNIYCNLKVCIFVTIIGANLSEPHRGTHSCCAVLSVYIIGRAGASPPSLIIIIIIIIIYIYDRHHTVYFSKCFYALLFHRHLSTFHTMRMRGVYVFDSTCTVLDQLGKCNRCMTMQRCLEQATAKLELFSDSTNKHKVLTCLLLYWKTFVEATIQVSILFFFLTSWNHHHYHSISRLIIIYCSHTLLYIPILGVCIMHT